MLTIFFGIKLYAQIPFALLKIAFHCFQVFIVSIEKIAESLKVETFESFFFPLKLKYFKLSMSLCFLFSSFTLLYLGALSVAVVVLVVVLIPPKFHCVF